MAPRDNASSIHDLPPVRTKTPPLDSPSELPLETITVYLTGFGSFGKITDNPSYNIVSSFVDHPGFLLTTSTRRIRVIPRAHPEAVKVSYEGVAKLIPEIYASQDFNYIIHVGVGTPGGYTLEMKAHATGYSNPTRKDVDGKTLDDTEFLVSPGASHPPPSSKGPTSPTTTLHQATRTLHSLSTLIPEPNDQKRSGTYGWSGDEIDLCSFIRTALNGPSHASPIGEPIRIRPSRDAGRYLCEWIYWCSCREALTNPPSVFSPPASPVAVRSKQADYGFPNLVHPTPVTPGPNGSGSFLESAPGNRNDITPSPIPGLVPEDTANPRTPYYGGYTNDGEVDEVDELNAEIDNEGAEYVTENVKRTKRVLFVHVPPDGQPYLKSDGVKVLEQVIVGMVRAGEKIKGELKVENLGRS
ncbi:hypothetical protein BJ508DRAFT_415228 [Ascobolus immersus RN42]|uniref:Peptidase C15, pyroglutamyl peptidase I-like protein n=1 Tax=Ascobolus immersus RN42 TaxID=1160509 RepID=A0A3N4I7Y7_ASCIM|nr:hypothetical protein BJ508DRAFT_415228 [Ascobolus immersus RN42]